ncbi:MAG: lipid-A-disaccharide synthase N-terminal domain-containing protein [Planctomycetes bacterium]|nr:lipid-A-disaccharide synthase N-terminal domain-containing protein [Planctomycetota bacterium]
MIAARATAKGRGVILRLFNVSSYANLLWVAVGFGGQALFAGRMWVQWIASERKRQSVVPVAFWYMSLAGGIILTTYFIWRQDLVGVVGQASGLVIYARNIRFLYLKKPAAAPES